MNHSEHDESAEHQTPSPTQMAIGLATHHLETGGELAGADREAALELYQRLGAALGIQAGDPTPAPEEPQAKTGYARSLIERVIGNLNEASGKGLPERKKAEILTKLGPFEEAVSADTEKFSETLKSIQRLRDYLTNPETPKIDLPNDIDQASSTVSGLLKEALQQSPVNERGARVIMEGILMNSWSECDKDHQAYGEIRRNGLDELLKTMDLSIILPHIGDGYRVDQHQMIARNETSTLTGRNLIDKVNTPGLTQDGEVHNKAKVVLS